jgi:hypothetical protein
MSPQSQGAFFDLLVIVPKLNRAQSCLGEDAVTDAERDPYHFKRIVSEGDRSLRGSENSLSRVIYSTNDLCVACAASFCQREENAKFREQQRERRLINRIDIG